jgi:hypothetical protein
MVTAMKFKDLPEKQIFTWWGSDHLHTGVKLGERQAFCFDLLCLVDIHANKDVKEPDRIDETLQYKVGHDGRGFLCSPISGGKVLARRIILLTGEIMEERFLKPPVSIKKTGGEQENLSQVYITLEIFERKFKDLETAYRMVKMILNDNLELETSDNKIMLTGDDPRRLIGQLQ